MYRLGFIMENMWVKVAHGRVVDELCARGCIYAAWRRSDAPALEPTVLLKFYDGKPIEDWVAPCRKKSYGFERMGSTSSPKRRFGMTVSRNIAERCSASLHSASE